LCKMDNMFNNKEAVKVRLTIGDITVEVETSLENVEEAVRRAVLGIHQAREAQIAKNVRQERRTTTCVELIERLVSEGWFSTPRSLSDVVGELARRGYHYDPTAIAHSLLDLVRRELLVREGKPKRYVYHVAKPLEKAGVEQVEEGGGATSPGR